MNFISSTYSISIRSSTNFTFLLLLGLLFGALLGPLLGQGHSPSQASCSPWHSRKQVLGKVLFSTPQTGPYTYAGHSKKHRICLDSFSVSAGADWIIIDRERTSSIMRNILNNFDAVLFFLASLCVVWTWLIIAGVFTLYLCAGPFDLHMSTSVLTLLRYRMIMEMTSTGLGSSHHHNHTGFYTHLANLV